MPELDGFEVARAIRDRERGTEQRLPIIALTARSSARTASAAWRPGWMSSCPSRSTRRRSGPRSNGWWLAGNRQDTRHPGPRPACSTHQRFSEPAGTKPRFSMMRIVFRRSQPAQMSSVRAAQADGDLLRLREAAHRLVGTVGTFSTVTAHVATTLEDAAEQQDRERCATLVERLGSLCDSCSTRPPGSRSIRCSRSTFGGADSTGVPQAGQRRCGRSRTLSPTLSPSLSPRFARRRPACGLAAARRFGGVGVRHHRPKAGQRGPGLALDGRGGPRLRAHAAAAAGRVGGEPLRAARRGPPRAGAQVRD